MEAREQERRREGVGSKGARPGEREENSQFGLPEHHHIWSLKTGLLGKGGRKSGGMGENGGKAVN